MNSPDLNRWIEEALQGTITDEDFTRLEAALRDNPEARHQWRRAASLDAALRDWASRDDSLREWAVVERAARGVDSRLGRKIYRAWVRAALVACLAFAAGWGYFWSIHSMVSLPEVAAAGKVEQTDVGCAILTDANLAVWESQGKRLRIGDTLNTGPLVLREGVAQIEFFSGASCLLQGPAELDLISPWETRCQYGKARVRVPPAARGFRLTAADVKLVDLGTEFGVSVSQDASHSQIHVFEGEVEVHPKGSELLRLKAGESLGKTDATLERISPAHPDSFVDGSRFRVMNQERVLQRFSQWQGFSERLRHDPRLVAYFPFQQQTGWNRQIVNEALPEDHDKNGGAVGAVWTQGRWPVKDALEFKHPGDRVRLRLDGAYEALTLTCWARVDGLDRKYNGLLLTDGYDTGAPHWQIYEDGRLMFSLAYPDPDHPDKRRNQIYYSPVVFDRANTGRWHQLAVTYENVSGQVIQYVDGVEVSREISPFHAPGRKMQFGPCELGNWGLPTPGHKFPIRNLNGCLDEFVIYRTVLSAAEIHEVYEAGRPD